MLRRFFDLAARDKDVISLTIGEPGSRPPKTAVDAAIRALEQGDTHYTSNAGIHQLREAISDSLRTSYGVSYAPDGEILITVGASEALHLALTSILDPGDEVLVPEPCFVAYAALVRLAGATPVFVATRAERGFQPDPADVERAITPRTRGLLIGYPNNPTGGVLDRATARALADIVHKHDLLLWSDEIYSRLVYGVDHVCMPAFPELRERTIVMGGASKSFAMTGFRVGWACGPKELIEPIHRAHQYMIMSAPTMAQVAYLAALEDDGGFVAETVAAYDRCRKLVLERLAAMGLPCFEPRGAFYVFPDIRSTGLASEPFCETLLTEAKVAVVPGNAFGASGQGFVRISYAGAPDQLERGLDRMAAFVRQRNGGAR